MMTMVLLPTALPCRSALLLLVLSSFLSQIGVVDAFSPVSVHGRTRRTVAPRSDDIRLHHPSATSTYTIRAPPLLLAMSDTNNSNNSIKNKRDDIRHSITATGDAHHQISARNDSSTELKGLGSLWTGIIQRVKSFGNRRLLLPLVLSVSIYLSALVLPAHAVTGGRAGGSFGRSSSFSSGRSSSFSSSRSYSSPSRSFSPRGRSTTLYYSDSGNNADDSFGIRDGIFLGGVVGVIAYDKMRTRQDGKSTVFSLTMSLNVSDREDPGCVMGQIESLSKLADTSTRQGVASLISNSE